ncbi:MAG: PRC-barrel domain-containing protein [Verrucomicrobiales bacterium]|nr:PRC-barrel domain-containing protein [Verrucomicrobiales bacterium]
MKADQIVNEVIGELIATGELSGARILDRDGSECGKVVDLLFGDDNWTIRYLVVDTGGFFHHEKVLISPWQLARPEVEDISGELVVDLTKQQIESSPPLDSDAPVSRQYEHLLADHYEYPKYWVGPGLWGLFSYPQQTELSRAEQIRRDAQMESIMHSHLRSIGEVTGYEAFAGQDDETVGKVEDLIFESGTWKIRYLIIRTGPLFHRKFVALSPDWASRISWESEQIKFDSLSRVVIDTSPEVDYRNRFHRDFEANLFDHYEKNYYWHP